MLTGMRTVVIWLSLIVSSFGSSAYADSSDSVPLTLTPSEEAQVRRLLWLRDRGNWSEIRLQAEKDSVTGAALLGIGLVNAVVGLGLTSWGGACYSASAGGWSELCGLVWLTPGIPTLAAGSALTIAGGALLVKARNDRESILQMFSISPTTDRHGAMVGAVFHF